MLVDESLFSKHQHSECECEYQHMAKSPDWLCLRDVKSEGRLEDLPGELDTLSRGLNSLGADIFNRFPEGGSSLVSALSVDTSRGRLMPSMGSLGASISAVALLESGFGVSDVYGSNWDSISEDGLSGRSRYFSSSCSPSSLEWRSKQASTSMSSYDDSTSSTVSLLAGCAGGGGLLDRKLKPDVSEDFRNDDKLGSFRGSSEGRDNPKKDFEDFPTPKITYLLHKLGPRQSLHTQSRGKEAHLILQ
jgi:hypothetical protein